MRNTEVNTIERVLELIQKAVDKVDNSKDVKQVNDISIHEIHNELVVSRNLLHDLLR